MHRGRFALVWIAWDRLRASWFGASRGDLLGTSAIALLLVGVTVAVVRNESWRGACFAKDADLQSALVRSDEAIRDASAGDLAGRCAAYRARLTVLDLLRRTTCSGLTNQKGAGLANVETESRFYSHLVQTKCNRTFDPSCSGPACDAGSEKD